MASLRSAYAAGIHVFSRKQTNKDVYGRNKSGHDDRVVLPQYIML